MSIKKNKSRNKKLNKNETFLYLNDTIMRENIHANHHLITIIDCKTPIAPYYRQMKHS